MIKLLFSFVTFIALGAEARSVVVCRAFSQRVSGYSFYFGKATIHPGENFEEIANYAMASAMRACTAANYGSNICREDDCWIENLSNR